MPRKIGTLNLDVYLLDDGNVDVKHQTLFCHELNEMQLALANADRQHARALRSKACMAAAEFMLYIRNPDERVELARTVKD